MVLKRQALCELRAWNRVSRPEYSCLYWWLLYCNLFPVVNVLWIVYVDPKTLTNRWLGIDCLEPYSRHQQSLNKFSTEKSFPAVPVVGWLHLGVFWQWPWRGRPWDSFSHCLYGEWQSPHSGSQKCQTLHRSSSQTTGHLCQALSCVLSGK